MKKNYTMRAATLLLVLTLITSCFVGGTFAKYTTEIAGSDTARVAQFGVTLAVDADLFDKEYDDGAISVKSHDDADVIAPGTTGTATIFTVAGAPEVDVMVDITLNGKADATPLTMVTLPAKNGYTDWTNQTVPMGTYDLATAYKPVLWTLTKTVDGSTTTVVDAKNLNEVETYLEGLCGKYEVEGTKKYADIVGTYTLTWNWDFDADDNINTVDVTDKYDTTLGQIAAGVETAPAGHIANESFAFYMNVTQVD